MNGPKRTFLMGLSSVAVGAVAELIAPRSWAQATRPPIPTIDDPPDQNAPRAPYPAPNIDPRVSAKQVLEHNDSQIHDNVEKLYFLASQLKAEVEKTDSQNVLSLGMVQKCEQIEKYAKQIKNLAKG
ncbi:MAG TPA: hypothetical protein VGD60_11695 [Candidatus Acidoferrales bacterium]